MEASKLVQHSSYGGCEPCVNQRIKAVKRGSTTDVKKGSALVHKYNNMPIKKCVR